MTLQQQNYEKTVSTCLIAFGSNLSNKFGASVQLIEAAIDQLSSRGLFKVERSGFFRTPAFPAGNGPDFVNGVLRCSTLLPVAAVLELLHQIESELGRERKQRWGARVIDLDLIDFAGQILPDNEIYTRWRHLPEDRQLIEAPDCLILPHPRVQDRLFVLIPLQQVCPNWRHPYDGKSICELIGAFDKDKIDEIRPLAP